MPHRGNHIFPEIEQQAPMRTGLDEWIGRLASTPGVYPTQLSGIARAAGKFKESVGLPMQDEMLTNLHGSVARLFLIKPNPELLDEWLELAKGLAALK